MAYDAYLGVRGVEAKGQLDVALFVGAAQGSNYVLYGGFDDHDGGSLTMLRPLAPFFPSPGPVGEKIRSGRGMPRPDPKTKTGL